MPNPCNAAGRAKEGSQIGVQHARRDTDEGAGVVSQSVALHSFFVGYDPLGDM